MASYFQAAALVACPSYPNSVAWSDENLVAVASGYLVTILNPASIVGPRGVITISPSQPFPIGVINNEDLLSGCLLPTCLSRDSRPCVRSMAWSRLGMAPNSGCLLAVCTTEGRVRLYRSPFCEFRAEWVEVADISGLLFKYLIRDEFGEADKCSKKSFDEQTDEHHVESGRDIDSLSLISCKKRKNRKMNSACNGRELLENQASFEPYKDDAVAFCAPAVEKIDTVCTDVVSFSEVIEVQSVNFTKKKLPRRTSGRKSKGQPLQSKQEKDTLPLLTPIQYASRSAMLSSLVIAWSPVLLSSENDPDSRGSLPNGCSMLAIGAKSGDISVWRIREPDHYSVEDSRNSLDVVLVGFHKAHSTWITAVTWAMCTNALKSQVLLVTGSSDGSVKIWLGATDVLLNSSEVKCGAFSLLKEVTTVASASVSVLSITVPSHSPEKVLLAIGRGSGSLEVGIFDITSCIFQSLGSSYAHNQVVTGLAWAYDSRCLYSCSQDDSFRCWNFCKGSLHEIPIPTNPLGLWCSTELPQVSDSCFGLATSPGNLVIALARGFDANLLNPMYQLRTQKAAVEFFWIGGQQVGTASDMYSEFVYDTIAGFSELELMCWESNILWSLKQHENVNRPLDLWDVIAALSALKHSAPSYVNKVLVKWFSNWLEGCNVSFSVAKILRHAKCSLSKVHSRKLHLLNIICRRLMLAELKADKLSCKTHNLGEQDATEDEELNLWTEVLISSEQELRERLVSLTFSTALSQKVPSAMDTSVSRYWVPAGVAQMEQWVASNHGLKLLVSEVEVLRSRHHSVSDFVVEEQCGFCSTSVPFESPEVAYCSGTNSEGGMNQQHKLSRCAVSMQVCPLKTLWFCVCCQRWACNLPPQTLFTLSKFPSDSKPLTDCSSLQIPSTPFCPFCGILLQKLQPEFLLSASPV